jgi:hypothetical protein
MWRRHLTLSTAEIRREWTCTSTPPYSFTPCTGTSLPRTCYVINICVAISYTSRMSSKVTEFYLYSFLTGVTKLFNKACISTLRYGNRTQAGARFSAPVQTGTKAHSASYTIGTGSLSRGVKRPGRGVNHPPPSSAEVKERVQSDQFWQYHSTANYILYNNK